MPKKLKGKEWYTLIAPKVFGEKEIGETPASDEKLLIGRRVETNLMNLTDDLSKYYIKFYFRVKSVKEGKAFTEFDGLECLRDYISRFIRYRVRRIDTIQDLKTKDGKKLRVKTITITSKKIKRNVERDLKKFVENVMKKEVESNDLDEFIKRIVDNRIKNYILNQGSKIYPIRVFEIRKVETLSKNQ